jgi:hypothetical protein
MQLSTVMQEHVINQSNSNLPVRTYCAQNNIKSSKFYYWRKKLGYDTDTTNVGFTPINMVDSVGTNVLTICFPTGILFKFNVLPDVPFLKNLLHATS